MINSSEMEYLTVTQEVKNKVLCITAIYAFYNYKQSVVTENNIPWANMLPLFYSK